MNVKLSSVSEATTRVRREVRVISKWRRNQRLRIETDSPACVRLTRAVGRGANVPKQPESSEYRRRTACRVFIRNGNAVEAEGEEWARATGLIVPSAWSYPTIRLGGSSLSRSVLWSLLTCPARPPSISNCSPIETLTRSPAWLGTYRDVTGRRAFRTLALRLSLTSCRNFELREDARCPPSVRNMRVLPKAEARRTWGAGVD